MKELSRKKYLFKNVAIFAIGNFSTKIISFFLVPLYTHLLSPEQYGIVDLFMTLSMLIMPILTLNISEAVIRFSMDKGADKNKILCIGVTFLVLSVIVGIFIIPAMTNIDKISEHSKLFYFYIVSFASSTIFLAYLRGAEKLVEYSVGNIIHSVAIAGFNILFLKFLNMGIKGYFVAYILANFVAAIYAMLVGKILPEIKSYRFDTKLCKEMLKYAVVLIPNSLMWWMMNSADRIMVTSYLGATENGIYAISYKIPSLLTMVFSVFVQAWSYSAVKEQGSDDEVEYNNTVYDYLFVVITILAFGMMMLIKPFLSIYVESSYYSAWQYTPFLIVGFVFMTLGSFIATSYTVHKDSKGFLFSATVGAVISIVLKFIMIPLIGIYGAALSTCISYAAVFVYRVIDTKKYLRINVLKKKHIISYVIMAITAATMFVDNVVGQVLLIAEFLLIVILFKDTLIAFVKPIFSKIFNKRFANR